MQVALNKVLAELNKQTRREPNDEDPLTLPTFAATSAPASQVSAGDGVKRVHSGSDLASASDASHHEPVYLLHVLVTRILVSISTMMPGELFTDDASSQRSRQSSVLSLADEKLHQVRIAIASLFRLPFHCLTCIVLQFDSEAAHVLRRAAAHRAALDQEVLSFNAALSCCCPSLPLNILFVRVFPVAMFFHS